MTTTRALALASAGLMALTLAACGERERKSADAEPAAPLSETVSDVAASEAPAAAVPASEASVRVPNPAAAAAEPRAAQTDLNDDEVAAAGDTRRRPAPSDAAPPQE